MAGNVNDELMKLVAEMAYGLKISAHSGCEDIAASYIKDWHDRLEALAATTRGTEVPEEVAVYRICHHCHTEYKVPLSPRGLWNFGPCPHCGKRDDVWIQLRKESPR